jgi:hypothetical protein
MSSSAAANGDGTEVVASLWDVNHEKAEDRIRARRKRISNRLEAGKRLATILKVNSMFGAAAATSADQEIVLEPGKYVLVCACPSCLI